jgi:hypothetical protein
METAEKIKIIRFETSLIDCDEPIYIQTAPLYVYNKVLLYTYNHLLHRRNEDGTTLTSFEETRLMSTYLLAIVVSDLMTLDTDESNKISIYTQVTG